MYNRQGSRHPDGFKLLVRIMLISLVIGSVGFAADAVRAGHVVESPDGKVLITFGVGAERGDLIYSVAFERLGLAIKDGASLETGFEISGISRSSRDGTYSPVYGERSQIRDHYNQLVVDLKEARPPHRKLRLTFRAYNEGAALRYTVPEQDALKDFIISTEETQFCFTGDHTAYAVYSAQGKYGKVPLSRLKKNCERPLVVEIGDRMLAAVAEAGMVDYARMRLSPDEERPNAVISSLASEVNAIAPLATPWRVIMLAKTPGELLDRNYLIMNLNAPCAIKDTSWIKPGKVIREVTLTTAGGMARWRHGVCRFRGRAQFAVCRIRRRLVRP